MTDRKHILTTAALVMVCLAVVVTATGTVVLYRSALAEKQSDLSAIARHEAQVIEATFRHDSNEHGAADHADPTSIMNCPKCSAKVALVIHILRESGNFQSGWGDGVEFMIAHRDEDAIRFLSLRKRAERDDIQKLMEVPWASELAEPMRLALSGWSGAVEARDYRGESVLAGYAPIKLLGWGVVAKIDLTEMRAPFVNAARTSIMIAALAILVGLIVLLKRLKPLIQRSQDSEEQALVLCHT